MVFQTFWRQCLIPHLGLHTVLHAGKLREKGGIALSVSWSCGINEILICFVSGFSFSKCGRASGSFSTALYTQCFQLIATFVSFAFAWKYEQNFPSCDSGLMFLFQYQKTASIYHFFWRQSSLDFDYFFRSCTYFSKWYWDWKISKTVIVFDFSLFWLQIPFQLSADFRFILKLSVFQVKFCCLKFPLLYDIGK